MAAHKEMRKVKAKAKGFCGVMVRKPGDVFMISGKTAPWFQELEAKGSESSGEDDEAKAAADEEKAKAKAAKAAKK